MTVGYPTVIDISTMQARHLGLGNIVGDKKERVKSKGKNSGCEIVFSIYDRGVTSMTFQKFGCLIILVLFLGLLFFPICLFCPILECLFFYYILFYLIII